MTSTKKKYLIETEAYANEEERLNVVWELLVYAHMIYEKVYVFKNYELFAKSFDVRDVKGNPPQEYWEGIHYEKLIDQIKVCVAFENYNKAILLKNGYMVHFISNKKNNEMARRQQLEPILISDFMQSNQFIQDRPHSEWYLDGLRKFNTIPFSLTLIEKYQNIIGLDSRFVNYLKNTNDKRNRLHYYKNYSGAFKVSSLLESIQFAKTYGKDLIEKEINLLKV